MMICAIDSSLHNYINIVPNSIHLRYKNGDVWINGEWLDVSLSRKWLYAIVFSYSYVLYACRFSYTITSNILLVY